ncbi:MAG: hypothetical protein WBV82_23050 [Myxococcaceae bacterium]
MIAHVLMLALAAAPSADAPWQTAESDAPVRVHIESDEPNAQLFRILSQGVGTVATAGGSAVVGMTTFRRECQAPCNRPVLTPSSDFFIAGPGVTASSPFTLLGQGQDVTLKVRAGSQGWRSAGAVSTYIGATGLVVGGSFLLVHALTSGASDSSDGPTLSGGRSDSSFTFVFDVGLWTTVAGAALTGIGIPLMIVNDTKVDVVEGAPPAQNDEATPSPSRVDV